ncbi:MAG TPA: hypothetical protein VJ715_08595 [Pyrinomonadaceae bacterium]|nr:hypothetical protein [Pyrinomonadaceae bacterium]
MNDKTQGLPDARSFEERVFARFDAMDARFNSMETRFDAMEARFVSMEARFDAMESRVEARFNAFETRLTTLEDKVDARLRETRPIWESMQQQMTEMAKTLDDIRVQIIELHRDSLAVRTRVARLEERERPPAA